MPWTYFELLVKRNGNNCEIRSTCSSFSTEYFISITMPLCKALDTILFNPLCTEKYSKQVINSFKKNKKKYENLILKKFEALTGYQTKNVFFQSIHGWKYAYSKINSNKDCLWLNKYNLGVCADWFNGPKAEDAWVSAGSLYLEIKKNPPKNRRV